MSDINVNSKIIYLLKRKWIYILLSGILFAVLFMGFKYYTKDSYTIAPNGDVLITQTIKIDNYKDKNDALKYDKYFTSNTYLYGFYENTKEKYDYNMIAPGWTNKTESQQMEWMKKHILVNYYGAGRIEISLDIKRSEAMNLDYLKDNGKNYVADFIDYLNTKDSLGEYQIINSVVSIPNSLSVSSRGVVIKYGIIGFVLGAITMITMIITWNLRKENNGKH